MKVLCFLIIFSSLSAFAAKGELQLTLASSPTLNGGFQNSLALLCRLDNCRIKARGLVTGEGVIKRTELPEILFLIEREKEGKAPVQKSSHEKVIRKVTLKAPDIEFKRSLGNLLTYEKSEIKNYRKYSDQLRSLEQKLLKAITSRERK